MKKFLAIYGLGFMAGMLTIEWVKLWVEYIKLQREAKDLSSKIKADLQNTLDRHHEWDWTEEQKQQLRNMGFVIK